MLMHVFIVLTGNSSAPHSKMAISEWIYISHVAANGSSEQHQCGQRQALPLLVGTVGPNSMLKLDLKNLSIKFLLD